jgi:hypothetical protein
MVGEVVRCQTAEVVACMYFIVGVSLLCIMPTGFSPQQRALVLARSRSFLDLHLMPFSHEGAVAPGVKAEKFFGVWME